MNEIPDLKDDLTFLKKFDFRSKVWKEFDVPNTQEKEKVPANFLLHPKRISSDSECSTRVNSPRRFLSGSNLNKLGLNEPNNNVHKPLHIHPTHTCKTKNVEKCCIGTGVGDRMELNTSGTKTLMTRRSSKTLNLNQFEVFNKKFKILVERCLKVLTNIRLMIEEGIAPPDGQEDYFRRTRRLQEFSARFSRIYLYPLLRQMDELSLPEKLGPALINQKFLYAQQVILQGLQAYYTHLPSSVGRCGSDKLKALLDQIIYLCHLYELLKKDSNSENWEFVNAMRSHVELLLETITTFDLKFVEKNNMQTEVKKKPKPQGNKQTRLNKSQHVIKTKSKLSMYIANSTFKKELEIRKGVDALKKKKYTVKSKYRTAGFKHRPAVEKQVASNVPNKTKLFNKSASGLLKSTSRETPIREDDIKTMVEIDSEFEAPPNTRENRNHENIASDRQQLVQDCDRQLNAGFEDGNVDKALEVLRKFFENSSKNMQAEFLEKIASEVDKRKEERGSNQRQSDKPKKKLKEPVMTITGAKNAKLICIRDDNSCDESEKLCKKDKEIMTEEEVKQTSSGTQTDLKVDKQPSKSTIKISRLPKHNRTMLTLLPKDYAINIIQYKLRYNHFHKHNPMYRKSVHIQPWVLMGKISDDILDYALRTVTAELEVNEILENLYNAEFQY